MIFPFLVYLNFWYCFTTKIFNEKKKNSSTHFINPGPIKNRHKISNTQKKNQLIDEHELK